MNNGRNNGLVSGVSKIKELDDLAVVLGELRTEGKTIVHCHGVFDLLHIGHIRHFQEAKALGDVLVVTTTQDQYVNKGDGRPAFTQQLRAEAIAALDCVDFVSINQWPLAADTIRLIQPHIYVKGSDYKQSDDDHTGGILLEEEAIRSVGGELAFTDDITFSSSHLINRHLPVLPEGASEYVVGLSERYSSNDILSYIDGARSLKILTIGEAIVDEYVYCEALGKSGKEPVLVSRQIDSERFAGGIVAVANNVASFSDQVGLLTFLGQVDSYEDFIRDNLNPNIDSTFLYMEDDSPTILKRRFVDRSPFHVQKLFELYLMDDGEPKPVESQILCEKLEELIPQYDAVLVTDYGHGMISSDVVDLLCKEARFLAVNTQMNAGNLGFNTVSKYSRADFLCVSENELRLDARSRRRDLLEIVNDISVKLSCDRVLITKGPDGCLCYGAKEGFFSVPALTSNVVDRVGAGDSVFAVSNLFAVQNAPIELVGFAGSLAGAQAVATVGHSQSLDRVSMIRHMETLLK
jgi:rfaE bifunctional protein kinase chain/domain/rfaE bifunctional protein nucleotidyltransferase chain/domain